MEQYPSGLHDFNFDDPAQHSMNESKKLRICPSIEDRGTESAFQCLYWTALIICFFVGLAHLIQGCNADMGNCPYFRIVSATGNGIYTRKQECCDGRCFAAQDCYTIYFQFSIGSTGVCQLVYDTNIPSNDVATEEANALNVYAIGEKYRFLQNKDSSRSAGDCIPEDKYLTKYIIGVVFIVITALMILLRLYIWRVATKIASNKVIIPETTTSDEPGNIEFTTDSNGYRTVPSTLITEQRVIGPQTFNHTDTVAIDTSTSTTQRPSESTLGVSREVQLNNLDNTLSHTLNETDMRNAEITQTTQQRQITSEVANRNSSLPSNQPQTNTMRNQQQRDRSLEMQQELEALRRQTRERLEGRLTAIYPVRPQFTPSAQRIQPQQTQLQAQGGGRNLFSFNTNIIRNTVESIQSPGNQRPIHVTAGSVSQQISDDTQYLIQPATVPVVEMVLSSAERNLPEADVVVAVQNITQYAVEADIPVVEVITTL